MGLPLFAILLLAAVLMMMLTLGPRSSGVQVVGGAVLTLLPAVLMSTIIYLAARPVPGHPEESTWRVTLAALRFPLPDGPISIGPDAQSDDLVIPGLPPNASTTLRLGPGAFPDVQIRDSVPGARGGAILLEDVPARDGDLEPRLGGTLIPPGSVICLSDDGVQCRGDSEQLTWVRQGNTALLRDASGTPLCELPPPSIRRTPTLTAKRIFPLATYARAHCAGTRLFAWAEGEPAGELLYWKEDPPSWGQRLMFWRRPELQLYLRPVDYNRVLIVKSGTQVTRIERQPITLAPGQEKHFTLYEIDPAAALPAAGLADDNFERMQERRSFALRYTEIARAPGAVLDVFLDTPQTVQITTSGAPAISISSQSGTPATLAGATSVAGFSLIGKPTAAALLSTVRPTASDVACRTQNEPLIVQGVTGITCAQVGRWFALGEPGRVLAKVRMAPIAVPVAWIAAIWALCLINLIVRELLKVHIPVRIILVVLELLLVLRVLVAFEAAAIDARREDTVAGAWLALLWLPVAFELVPPSAAGWAGALLGRALKLLLVLGGTVLIAHAGGLGSGEGQWSAWLASDVGKSAFISAALCLPAALLVWGPRLLAAVRPPSRWQAVPGRYGTLFRAAIPLIVLGAIHLGLVIAGLKEQIGGVRIASILIPLLVLAWAQWYGAVRRERDSLDALTELGALLAPFLAYFAFVLARDVGAFIYFIGLAAWMSVGTWPSGVRQWVLWAAVATVVGSALLTAMTTLGAAFQPLLVPGAAALVASLAVIVLLAPRGQWAALRPHLASLPALAVITVLCTLRLGGHLLVQQTVEEPSHTVTWADVSRIQELSSNAIRLLDLLAPQTVEDLGIRTAYEQRVAMAEMLQYGASPSGKGWLRIPAPDALRDTHVDDNVTAVHLLGPFGRVGGLGVGILLLTFAATIRTLAAAWPGAATIRAELASTMLVVTSLYMLLANVGEVPFTGRNFYFLAVASRSDLLEGGMLLIIVLSAFFATPAGAEEHATA